MRMAEIWKIVWPGALTRQRAAGKTDAVMKRSLSRVGSLLKVDGDIFMAISTAAYSFLIVEQTVSAISLLHWLT